MPETDKIVQFTKGIDDDTFQVLVAKSPQTVTELSELCQSFDEPRKPRLSTRRSDMQPADISAQESRSIAADYATLMPHIKQYVREELSRQLSLVAFVTMDTGTLEPPLRRVIKAQVAEALPAPALLPQLTTPLTHAEALTPS